MSDRIQFRRDTAANWTAYNPILLEGELGFELDTDQYKLGDGIHTWSALPYRGAPCVQQMGSSTTTPMSQKAVTDELNLIGVFDISAHNLTDGQPTKYADLTAALGTNGANVPTQYRVPGMTVRYVQSSDNMYVQYRLMSDTFNTTAAYWQGVDDELTLNNNLVKGKGIITKITSSINGVNIPNSEQSLLEFSVIENSYLSVDAKVLPFQGYNTLYMLPIHEYQRLELIDVHIGYSSRLILYDNTMQELYNNYFSEKSYTIDNRSGVYYYMSIGYQASTKNFRILGTPRNYKKDIYDSLTIEEIDLLNSPCRFANLITSENKLSSGTQEGYGSIFNMYVKFYKKLSIIGNEIPNTSLRTIFLTHADGTVTTMSHTSDHTAYIENLNGDIEYISFNIRISGSYVKMYCINQTTFKKIYPEDKPIIDGLINVKELQFIPTSQLSLIDISQYIRVNTYIDSIGRVKSYNGYSSAYLVPVKKFSRFVISGSIGTSSFTVMYNDNLEILSVSQGLDVTIDNTLHNIAYISFSAGNSTHPPYLKANYMSLSDKVLKIDSNISISDVIPFEKEISGLSWVDESYIKPGNIVGTIRDDSERGYFFKTIHNYYINGAVAIRITLYTGSNGRVVLLDSNLSIIDEFYFSGQLEIDNSEQSIEYISLTNNFGVYPNPILYLSSIPTIGEEVAYLSKNKVDSTVEGKNLAVLGDSIMMVMAGGGITGGTTTYVGTDDVTYELSDLTNIGGLLYVTSTLEDGEIVSTTIRADIHNSNQENLDVETWTALKESLKLNSLINTGRGGATIHGGTITTAFPAHGQPTFNTMPNHCLELKRRVDAGEPAPDYIMMWAGTNDVGSFVINNNWVEPTNYDEIMALDYETQLIANTDSAMNYKKTFYGGLRFCIEFLSRNFPNSQLIFFAPIQSAHGARNYERETKVGSYIKKMVERYSCTFVNALVEIGISDIFDTETSHVWLYDGLHPNGAGKILYCNYTAKKLNEIAFSKI